MAANHKCFWFMLMWVSWRVETCAHEYRHARAHAHTQVHTHTPHTYTRTRNKHTRNKHTHTHNFPDNTAGSIYAISEKSSNLTTLSLQNMYTCILTILLHYHLAGKLILMNCQNMLKSLRTFNSVCLHGSKYSWYYL